MGAVTPKTRRVVLQGINICILLHVGFLFTFNYDARNHELKKSMLHCQQFRTAPSYFYCQKASDICHDWVCRVNQITLMVALSEEESMQGK